MGKISTLRIGFLIFLCVFSFLLSSANGEERTAPTLYVGGSGPGNYTVIQDALDHITTGGTVIVFPGMYHEHIIVTTSIHLLGDSKESTILDGDNEGYVVILDVGNTTLSGFTITHSGRTFPKAGVYVKSDGNVISGNILTGNYYGMVLESAADNIITSNEIIRNLRCGVYFSRASHNTLTGNIVSNHSFNGFGLYEFSNNNTIVENVFSENNYSGVNIRDSLNNRVYDNQFIGDRVGLHVPPPTYRTVFHGNAFTENHIDLEEEKNPIVMIGVGYAVLLILVFFFFKKWKAS
jgi:parallel beta-helix repeat protein